MTVPTASTVLVVEDEPGLSRGLEINLKREGYRVVVAATGEAGLDLAIRHQPQLILLDVTLPGMNGFDVCREVRARGMDVPIIFLTARTEELDRVLGLELGADDYVVKPFMLRELLARVRTRLRRHSPKPAALQRYRLGEVDIDFDAQVARRGSEPVEFTAREFDLLRLFIACRGQVVTRDRILDEVWGYEAGTTTRTVDNFVLRLRQKLEPVPSEPRYFLTVYGSGYKFVG
ncbi:DNA-binding response regulator [Luteitalea sp. TBR-22]|uniref:response regulator transcription factor n=1 Tax=Luteitalea sp. TBR-22 TaxID=2802971 RepID=UPI001AFBF07F|nr:response regulator transcription factor [Luteitalea sp. TBR-22]BCS32120.1 DNA-binding response regulator [Luteitalea sp. TBR-22]